MTPGESDGLYVFCVWALFMSSVFSLRSHKALCQSSEVNITPTAACLLHKPTCPAAEPTTDRKPQGTLLLLKWLSYTTLHVLPSPFCSIIFNNTNTYLYYKDGLITELVIGLEGRSTGSGWRTIFCVCIHRQGSLHTIIQWRPWAQTSAF